MANAPHARPDLLVHDVADETVVYDPRTRKAHCLSAPVAAVFRACDGKRSPAALAKEVRLDEPAVWQSLGELERAGLLRAPLPRAMTRRRALRALGVAAAVPAIFSVLAPTPAYAATAIPCVRPGQCSGTDPNKCCGGLGGPAKFCDGPGKCNGTSGPSPCLPNKICGT